MCVSPVTLPRLVALPSATHGRGKEAVMDGERNLDELLNRKLSRRELFRNAAVAGISLPAVLDLTSQQAASAATPPIGSQLIGKLEGPTTITDASKFPKSFKEAPQLAELVKAGKLPSVKERIGEDPLVIKPVHEIGRYGGTIRRGFTGPGDWSAGVRFCGNDSLVHWDVTGTKPTPLAAKGWQFSDGDRTMTMVEIQGSVLGVRRDPDGP